MEDKQETTLSGIGKCLDMILHPLKTFDTVLTFCIIKLIYINTIQNRHKKRTKE